MVKKKEAEEEESVAEETAAEEPKHDPFAPPEGESIDDRMASLLADHQAMGTRPVEGEEAPKEEEPAEK